MTLTRFGLNWVYDSDDSLYIPINHLELTEEERRGLEERAKLNIELAFQPGTHSKMVVLNRDLMNSLETLSTYLKSNSELIETVKVYGFGSSPQKRQDRTNTIISIIKEKSKSGQAHDLRDKIEGYIDNEGIPKEVREKYKDNPEFQSYKRRTSAFFPLPTRKEA